MNTIVPKNIERYRSHYKESNLWSKIKSVAKKAGVKVIYAALLLYYVLQSPDVCLLLRPSFLNLVLQQQAGEAG